MSEETIYSPTQEIKGRVGGHRFSFRSLMAFAEPGACLLGDIELGDIRGLSPL